MRIMWPGPRESTATKLLQNGDCMGAWGTETAMQYAMPDQGVRPLQRLAHGRILVSDSTDSGIVEVQSQQPITSMH